VSRPAPPDGLPLLAALVLVLVPACDRGSPAPGPAEPAAAPPAAHAAISPSYEPPPGAVGPSGEDSGPGTIRRQSVVVYYPAAGGDGLIGEPHEIFMTSAPGDRIKQIVADLIAGPGTASALRAVPPGTRLRQVYVLDDGTAFIDFSADLKQGMAGGSTEELLTVYAIIDSVAMNVSEVRRVGILVDGKPIDTLNGHLDLRRPLPPDPSLILEELLPEVARAVPTGPERA
jgi:hypothetical protein